MRFNNVKYKVVCLSQANPWHQETLADEGT